MLETIFYHIDEFNKKFEKEFESRLLTSGNNKRKRAFQMISSEIMTIMIWYHHSGYKTFKDYYEKYVLLHMGKDFNNLVSYNRFLELRSKVVVPLTIFLQLRGMQACTGISYIDSFPLEVCHIKRAYSHKTFKQFAKKGRTSVGWFFGFKLHVVINHTGEIIACMITPGNVSDSHEDVVMNLTQNILGKLFGDRGYIGQKLFEKLYKKGIQLITRVRKNMKNKFMNFDDKILLKKRGVVESVGSILKESLSLEHSRHRSYSGFFAHIMSSLIAYAFREKKPSISTKNLTMQLPA